ncbi:MAG: cob(I)yrinic acid a,c-diamide adenosyltransferase [Dehalococcoidales bacterium]|nr:cob(I)yrinic acid a,c-diamide adenosyltransferase [Dehalococcoidales bacterium]
MENRPEEHSKTAARGLVLVLTGEGKGKTTSALGMVLRAWGHDLKTAVLQFVKSPDPGRGESLAMQKLGLEMVSGGGGFTWKEKNSQINRTMASELWSQAVEMIGSGRYDLIVLDEFTYALKFGWIDINDVIRTLSERPQGLHVIITGRDAPPELVDFSDCAVEMQSLKHHLRRGIRAQPGIEY